MNINELTAKAASTIGILENIAGYEPGDIEGDTVELRFEDETGCDTGCDVSIVEQCQSAADVIRALTEALEAAEKRIADLEKYASDRDSENESMALKIGRLRCELEAKTLTVQLPPNELIVNDNTMPGDGWEVFDAQKVTDALKSACADAVKLQIEGE